VEVEVFRCCPKTKTKTKKRFEDGLEG
jgi:hypothetical protein